MESFLYNIAESVLGKLSSLALEEFFLIWGLENDLENIKGILVTITAVLLDAEQQQSKNHRIRVWLSDLKDVLYDIEDVVEEFECEALRRQVMKNGRPYRKVRRFFSRCNPLAFRYKMAQKIKDIKKRTIEIASLKSNFGLTESINDAKVIHKEREMTHSFVDAADVVGRKKLKQKITNHLLEVVVDGSGSSNVSILPIVGMGGLGKTTLAKLVYSDQRVSSHFGVKLWACVSDSFDLQKVIIKILMSATGKNYTYLDLDQLQIKLREILEGKKYLLVLDDVWNDDHNKWLELKTLLMGGANGSKILVTTRSKHVASIMGTNTMTTYQLSYLSHEDCMSLFIKRAFKEGQEKKHPNLLKIGEEMVRKCKGVPLAVIALGTLLYSVTDERQWMSIRDNKTWKEGEILPVLRLSYDHLPSHLKRCFAYCSIFPKDYTFDDVELVYYWMGLGLLQSENQNQNQNLEDMGFCYLNELYSRCFFQDFSELHGNVRFKMHDLLHDLALSVSENEFSTIDSATQQISKNVRRHLSFSDPESLPTSLENLQGVRTISFLTETRGRISSEPFLKACFSRFNYLRLLDMADSKFEELPKEIGNLKHLKYLSVAWNFNIKKLPNSICKLQSLQSLLLYGCRQLQELPRDLSCLISLRFLWLTTSLKHLPEDGLGSLRSLQYLFITDCERLEHLFRDMKSGLKSLRSLVITHCPGLISLHQNMKCLTALESLFIANCVNLNLEYGEDDDDEEDACQFSRLRKLHIERLPKLVDFPEWLLPVSTDTLKSLEVVSCPNLRKLPENLNNSESAQYRIRHCPMLNYTWQQNIGTIAGPSRVPQSIN